MKNLYKFIIILLLVFIVTNTVLAVEPDGILKAILIIEDDYIEPQLNSIAESTHSDYNLVSKFLDLIDRKKIMTVEKTVLQGTNATRKNIVTLLKNIKLTSNDILLFYFSGHGGMINNNTFLLTAEGDCLFRTELESLVKSHPTRLSLVFTDACSSSIDTIGGRGAFSKKTVDKENAFIEIYKNLLYNYQGLLYVTSATEGEYAWGGRDGGAFTKSMFYEVLLQNPKLSWEENFNEAKKNTQAKFTYMKNMGIINPEDLKNLENKGIKSQTPKAYSLPILKNSVAIDNQVIETQQKIDADTNKSVEVTINNLTDKTITFYIDDNLYYDKRWSWDYCKKKVIKPKSTMVIDYSKPIIVFFDNGKQKSLSYELISGSYIFKEELNGAINLFTEINPTTNQDSDNLNGAKDQTNNLAVLHNYSTKVKDVFQPYTADEWIISPNDEPINDHKVSNAPECDIWGVISCYDENYIRMDILLNNSITFKWDVWYGVKLEFPDAIEYYIYYINSKKLVYKEEKAGKITKTKTLTKDNSNDFAGITNSGDKANSDVYFILNKRDHIAGVKGKNYYLPCTFLSGYINEDAEEKIADQTVQVELNFTY